MVEPLTKHAVQMPNYLNNWTSNVFCLALKSALPLSKDK